MAASKSYFARPNYRFLSNDSRDISVSVTSDTMFELDESDVWNNTSATPTEFRKPTSRVSRKQSVAKSDRKISPAVAASSLPVNVPDWSKILKEEYRENRRRDSDGDDFDGVDGDDVAEDRIPPHEFLARQFARTRIASYSVHEGVGRTLKGRDLSRVRNAIFEKTGFQD